MKNSVKNSEVKVVKRTQTTEVPLGRPVNPNSARQIRLAELEAKRANGELRRGRPVDSTSARQFRLQIQAINKQLGIGQGRPVNPNSARQMRLAELEARRVANGGVIKRGRPAAVKADEVAA